MKKKSFMISNKQKAIRCIEAGVFNFQNIDKTLLQDKDVAIAYMRKYSSNEMLLEGFPIDIAIPGMIDDETFVLNVIQNLDKGYSKTAVWQMIKCSAVMIAKNESRQREDVDVKQLKDFTKDILTRYNSMVKTRDDELNQNKTIIEQLCDYIRDFELDAFDEVKDNTNENDNQYIDVDKYKRCKIGFTADIK